MAISCTNKQCALQRFKTGLDLEFKLKLHVNLMLISTNLNILMNRYAIGCFLKSLVMKPTLSL